MKQMKFLLVALMTVLMGMSVTSCLKGDDNNTVTMTVPVKYNYTSFLMGDGVTKLVPNSELGVLSGTMYIISCQYDRSQVTNNTTSIPVTLIGNPVCIDPKSGESLTSQKIEPTNPLYTLDKQRSNLDYFDKNTIVLTMSYWVKVTGSTVEESEVNKHSFSLYYDPEEIKEGDTRLTLHISHRINDTDKVDRNNWTYAYRAYSISNALYQFKEKSGKLPQYIILKAETNTSEDKLKTENGEPSAEYAYPFKE